MNIKHIDPNLLKDLKKQSPRGVLLKKDVLINFAKFTGKHLCQNLSLNKREALGFRPVTLLKERFWHRCFFVNFTKFLKTLFFTEHLWWLLLDLSGNTLT